MQKPVISLFFLQKRMPNLKNTNEITGLYSHGGGSGSLLAKVVPSCSRVHIFSYLFDCPSLIGPRSGLDLPGSMTGTAFGRIGATEEDPLAAFGGRGLR